MVSAQESRSSRLPRVDSGVIPKDGARRQAAVEPALSERRDTDKIAKQKESVRHQALVKESKRAVESPSPMFREQGGSNASGFISRLDPGPSRSEFAQPIDLSKFPSKEIICSDAFRTSSESSPGRGTGERGRSTGKKPARSSNVAAHNAVASQLPGYDEPQLQTSKSVQAPTPSSYAEEVPKEGTLQATQASTPASHPDEEPKQGALQTTQSLTPPPANLSPAEGIREEAERTYTLPRRTSDYQVHIWSPASRLSKKGRSKAAPKDTSFSSQPPSEPAPRADRVNEETSRTYTLPNMALEYEVESNRATPKSYESESPRTAQEDDSFATRPMPDVAPKSPNVVHEGSSRTYTLPSRNSDFRVQRQLSAIKTSGYRTTHAVPSDTTTTLQAKPNFARQLEREREESVRTYTLPNNFHEYDVQSGSAVPRSSANESSRTQSKDTVGDSQTNPDWPLNPETVVAPQPTQSATVDSQLSLQSLYSSPQLTANHNQYEYVLSPASPRQTTLPPIAVLQGFKVNKKGKVLDEEGEAIGELFEGDLIDCVRQRVNAQGEVLDEYGNVVGRVRTIQKSSTSAVRPLQDIQQPTTQSAAWQPWDMATIAGKRNGPVAPLGPQQYLSQPLPMLEQRVPADAEGNTFVAELDGSIDAEVIPVIDHSDIFLPPLGSSKRSQSPAHLMRWELPAHEQRRPSNTTRESVARDGQPKQWASRNFEPGLQDGDSVATQSPQRRDSSRSDHSSRSGYNAVLGPTLEDLEEPASSSRATTPSQPPMDPTKLGIASRSSTAATRRSSVQNGTGTSLAPTSSRSSYFSHQPTKRSPLASYEVTPPGSGAGNKTDVEPEEDAATPPDIMKAKPRVQEPDNLKAKPRAQELKTSSSIEKTVEKRKSRMSFMMFGKKEQAAATAQ
ncbi:hypothetical protein LTR37_015011 [Vermiconidia calcicola]|uniref:Uncharacterized protein n=1 Tax=Vermiconidia calcicola TaxID=1690605 RepID=A0ACC3MRR6_9PEZI|nr:hypothetical protein LTR37_015011 [Vermiconidia calcicola]